MPEPLRATKNEIDPELLRRLYGQCEGWIQRDARKAGSKRTASKVKYSTLTRMLRPEVKRGRVYTSYIETLKEDDQPHSTCRPFPPRSVMYRRDALPVIMIAFVWPLRRYQRGKARRFTR